MSEEKRVVLYASITPAQHEALRYIAFGERRSIADVTREALDRYIESKAGKYPPGAFRFDQPETVEARKPARRRRAS